MVLLHYLLPSGSLETMSFDVTFCCVGPYDLSKFCFDCSFAPFCSFNGNVRLKPAPAAPPPPITPSSSGNSGGYMFLYDKFLIGIGFVFLFLLFSFQKFLWEMLNYLMNIPHY